MVMKIAHAQLHMYTNIMYMQNCRWKAPDKIVSTDRQTAMVIPVYPLHFNMGGV